MHRWPMVTAFPTACCPTPSIVHDEGGRDLWGRGTNWIDRAFVLVVVGIMGLDPWRRTHAHAAMCGMAWACLGLR
jgi:hypothetical protein